ncbi:MAG: DUF3341 domain-containing protein [Myxococcales bacterium]|nr:MAG: DUF3341 domain-containing protein [Myxococcales bacterium]
MSGRGSCAGVVGVFAHVDALMDALQKARGAGLTIRDVYSPVPNPEILEFVSPGRSPVRFVTLGGAITGCVSGLALAILSSLTYNLIVSGKPVTAIVPFLVVAFELTILFGALSTLAALLFFSKLPFRRFPAAAYRPEFSDDRFGLFIACDDATGERASALLAEAGAERVDPVTG